MKISVIYPLGNFDFKWLNASKLSLTLSRRRSLSYRNQFKDLHSNSMDRFLYDRDLRRERVKQLFENIIWFYQGENEKEKLKR